jgi:hypothetical protein
LKEFVNSYKGERLESVMISTPFFTPEFSFLSPFPSGVTIGDLVADPIKSTSSQRCVCCVMIFYNEEERKKYELALNI